MPVVDISTVIVVLIIGHCLSSFFLALDIFCYNPTMYDYLFLIGRVLQAVGWGLVVAREALPFWLSFSVGNSALLGGWMLEALAVISLKYVITRRCIMVYASIVAVSQLVLWPVLDVRLTVAVLVTSCLSALMFFIPGKALLTSKQRSSPPQKVMGVMYCLSSAVMLWRGIDEWVQGSYRLFTANLSQVVSLLMLTGLGLIGCMGYVLIKKEHFSWEMKTYAETDPLTNLYNRRAFLLLSQQLIQSAIRKQESIALLIIDIDHFKRINDRYGHGAGDVIIANLAQVMRETMRKSDIACRYGGEEFIIMLPDCDKTAAIQIAERLRFAVERATPNSHFYTVSIGVASATGRQIRLENLIKRADMAMYKAKDMGRNRVQSE